MKKLFIAFSVLFSISVLPNTQAQDIALEGGLSLNTFVLSDVFNDVFDTKLNTGVSLGINSNIPIAGDGRFIVKPGVRFSKLGGTLVEEEPRKINDTTQFERSYKFNTNYLQIPVLLQVGITNNTNGFFASAGPYLGIGISGKRIDKQKSKNIAYNKSETEDIEFGTGNLDDLYRYDWGAILGFGYFHYDFNENGKKKMFTAGLQIGIGMSNILSEGFRNEIATDMLTNLSFQVNIAYTLIPLSDH